MKFYYLGLLALLFGCGDSKNIDEEFRKSRDPNEAARQALEPRTPIRYANNVEYNLLYASNDGYVFSAQNCTPNTCEYLNFIINLNSHEVFNTHNVLLGRRNCLNQECSHFEMKLIKNCVTTIKVSDKKVMGRFDFRDEFTQMDSVEEFSILSDCDKGLFKQLYYYSKKLDNGVRSWPQEFYLNKDSYHIPGVKFFINLPLTYNGDDVYYPITALYTLKDEKVYQVISMNLTENKHLHLRIKFEDL